MMNHEISVLLIDEQLSQTHRNRDREVVEDANEGDQGLQVTAVHNDLS